MAENKQTAKVLAVFFARKTDLKTNFKQTCCWLRKNIKIKHFETSKKKNFRLYSEFQ